MTNDLKLSVFSTLQSYESKPLSLDTILWWIRQDKSVAEKTELYRNMARTITPDEAKKKVKEAMMPAFTRATEKLFFVNWSKTQIEDSLEK